MMLRCMIVLGARLDRPGFQDADHPLGDTLIRMISLYASRRALYVSTSYACSCSLASTT
jgi:hypothetical protein